MQKRGVKLFDSDEMGDMAKEEKSDMMTMVVVPTHILNSRNE